MKISSKSEYGLRALFDLAEHFEQSPRRSREIGLSQKIPEDYLNQLLIYLRKAGLINSLRGPQGGHVLARPPAQITLFEIVQVLEGDISPVAHQVEPIPFDVVLNEVWTRIEDDTTRVLRETTLQDLCERYQERQNASSEAMYYI